MRSRTELVTTTLDGSDFDEETDFEDSEEDWRPEKGDQKALKRKTRDIVNGSGGGKRGRRSKGGPKRSRKPAAKSRATGTGRRRKFDDGDDEDDDGDDDDNRFDSEGSGSSTPPVPKRGRKSTAGTPHRAYGRKNGSKTPPSTSKVPVKLSPATSPVSSGGLDSSPVELTIKPIQRKVANTSGSFPDKSGYLKLFAARADLEEGIRDNLKVCLWRRDGSSLLQKYNRVKSVDASTPQFTSSMVYSCWEDKRADEYMEVKVRCIEQTKQLRVQIIDVEATESRAKEEYQKYIETYGKSIDSSEGKTSHNSGDEAGEGGDEQGGEEYEGEEPEEDEKMQEGVEGSDEPSQEE